MEECGGLASHPYPTGPAVSCPSPLPAETLRPDPQNPGNHDGPEPLANTLLPEDPVKDSREPPKEDSGVSGSVEHACAQVAPHRTSAGPPLHHSVGPRTTVNPHGGAETCASSRLCQGDAIGANNGLHVGGGGGGGGGGGISGFVVGGGGGGCGGGDVIIQNLQPASLPVQRSPSEAAQVEACGPAYHAQKAQGQVEGACKPSPQPQRCNVLAAAYHHDASCPAQLLQGAPVHVCGPRGGNAPEDCVTVESHHHHRHLHHLHHLHPRQQQQCEEAIPYGSYANHGRLEDGFSACCHPQPLLAPAQQPLCMADMEHACQYQTGVPAPLEAPLLAIPRLISSVSETGLDTTGLLGCCSLGCSWAGPFPPGGGGFRAWTEERQRAASRTIGPAPLRTAAAIRDTGTMTAPREVRDVGVQTSLPTPPHVFPQVCLVEEVAAGGPPDGGEGGEAGGPCGVGGHDAKRGSLKSPVKEVKWDAEGMTWEVYGASVDPEELGLAIQRHLELQIKETASRAAKLSRQGTTTSHHSCASASGIERGKKRGRVTLGSFRPPACCARTTTAVD